MKAFAVLEGTKHITEITLPTPVPEGSEVLLRVLHSGVCHSDTHLLEGGYDLGSRGTLKLSDRGIPYPLVMGHEVVGIVEKVGPEAPAGLLGTIRLVYPWIGCGSCTTCRAGRDNECAAGRTLGVARPGGYAEHILVADARYLFDIDGLDPKWAATLACSGLTAYSAVNKVLPLAPTDPVVVIGAGGVGLTAIALLQALGHRNVVAMDVSAGNLELAKGLGATTSVLAGTDSTPQDLSEAAGEPIAAVIDFVNSGATSLLAFEVLRKGGHLVQVGLFGGEIVVPTALMALRILTLQGSFVGNVDELKSLVELAKSGAVPHIPIIPGALDEASVASSLADLIRGGVPGRIVLSST